MNIKAILKHKSLGERIFYAGQYDELIKCGILLHKAYVKAIASGDCILIIEGISEEEKMKTIEQIEFEASISKDVQVRKWES